MKIVSINLTSLGSTGKIMQGIHAKAIERGHKCIAIVPKEKGIRATDIYSIGSRFTGRLNRYAGIVTGLDGCFNILSTLKAIKKIDVFGPDIIHLHNLHNTYINIPLLMRYIRKNEISVVWTLHDCWAFTGHCPHFTYEKCNKWKCGCNSCPRYRMYPKSVMDNSRYMWKRKKKWFTNHKNITLVSPSQWLADLVSESYLNEYPIKVINNGIDLEVFKKTTSSFRQRYNIDAYKKIVLGVAFGWGEKKGIDVILELSNRLSEKYQIVIVGTNDIIDEKLDDKIISIHKTQNQKELAEIYSAANVFINPTREEVLGLTNIEANACGTPVITFDSGGSPECIDSFSGVVVKCDDVDSFEKEVIRICSENIYDEDDCIKRAKLFSIDDMYNNYISLYEEIIY